MAAPANSGESDMATEDFCSTLQLCLTPSPLRPFLPSSNSNYSMVMQYQGSNQCMDNPLQNQQWHEEDMVDSAPYLAGDSALLQQQQQLSQNGSEASDWRPSGGGIMKMNNQGFEESNMGFEEESEEMMVMNCISFPPSPTDFPLHQPLPSLSNSTVLPMSDLCNLFEKNLSMMLSNEQDMNNMAQEDMNNMAQDLNKLEQDSLHIFKDESSFLDATNGIRPYDEGFAPYIDNIVKDLDRIIGAKGMMSEDNVLLVQNALQQEDMSEMKLTFRMMNLFEHGSEKKKWFEQDDGDNVGQPVLQMEGLVRQLIQNRGGELDFIPGGRYCTINGLDHSDGQNLPMITEPSVVFQTKFAVRVWRGYGGQWMAEIRLRQRINYLNLGIFTTMEVTSAPEMVMRWSGWMDLTGFPESFQKANRSKLPLQLPPLAQEENPDEDFGLVHYNARGNDEIEAVGTGSEGTWDCVMAHQARLNLGKRKTKEKNPEGERRNKKTNGVRIAIPLEDILQTKGMHLKDAANHLEVSIAELESSCRDYDIQIWPPRNEHKLIRQSLLSETLTVVDQEGFPQLSSHTMPSNQALTVTVGTNTFFEKEIPSLQFLPTARQENPDAGFGNDEDEAIGMEVGGTGEGVMVEAQFNSGCSGKGKWKEKGLGGERGNNKTTGVRIAIPKEDISRTKGMHLKDAAKHLEVGRSTLEHNLISCPNNTPVVVDQEGIPQLNSDTLPSDQALAATVCTNSVVVKEIQQPQFSLIDRQDNPDDDFGKDEVEAIGMVGEGTGEGKMEEGQLNSGCLGKGKNKEETSGGDRRNKKTNGFKIAISLDEILQAEGMLLKDAATKFKVSRSTLKRVCRMYGIPNWPPSKGNEHICQSCPKETPAVVDQEGAQQLNCEILPSDRALTANVDTNSVVLKARWVDDIIVKIRLPKPWKMAELEQQVKKRLKLESGTYYIKYKDEENELITILCDEDLQEYISSSRPLGTSSIEVFLGPN